MRRRLVLFILLLGAVGLSTPARAIDSPWLTDTAGDADGADLIDDSGIPLLDGPSDPSQDLVAADVELVGDVLRFRTEVLDLTQSPRPANGDWPVDSCDVVECQPETAYRDFTFTTHRDAGGRVLDLSVIAEEDATTGPKYSVSVFCGRCVAWTTAYLTVTGTWDLAADEITVDVPLVDLNAALAAMGDPDLPPVAAGDVLFDPTVNSGGGYTNVDDMYEPGESWTIG